MEAEGADVPELLPATFIECTNKKATAAAKLVLIYSSIYAKITNEGLNDFLELFEIELEEFKGEIDLPEFSMPRFEQKFQSFGEEGDDEDEQTFDWLQLTPPFA